METKTTFLKELLQAVKEWGRYYRRTFTDFNDNRKKVALERLRAKRSSRAIKLADIKSKANGGKRVYVLEAFDGKFYPCLKKEVDMLKRRGLMNKKATFADLLRESIYHTK